MSMHDDAVSVLRHFRRHKLRTGLAVLGVAASVASIIVLTSVADAMRRDKMRYFGEAGARIAEVVLLDRRWLELLKEEPYEFGGRGYRRYDSLEYRPIEDWRDGERIKGACANTVIAISPIVTNPKQEVGMTCGLLQDGVVLHGVTDDFFNCIAPRPLAGRTISREDMEQRRRVVLLSWEVQHEDLALSVAGGYPNLDSGYAQLEATYGKGYGPDQLPKPLLEQGPVFRINGVTYDVVGLLPPYRPVLENFFRWNWAAFVPFPCVRETAKLDAANRFIFCPKRSAEEAFAELKPVLQEMYPGCTPVMHSAEMWAREERRSLAAATTGFLVIGLGTLVVSAIAVMNTMLVSVRERRLEIGLRKAVGASHRAVSRQFTNETLLLCSIGIAMGIGAAVVAALVLERSQNQYLIPLLKEWRARFQTGAGGQSMAPREWDIRLVFLAVASGLAIVATLAVALLASVLPAREAAGMQAADCLRRSGTDVPRRSARGPLFRILRAGWLRPLAEDPERTWLAISASSIGVAVLVVLTSVGEYTRLRTAEWAKFVGADAINFHFYNGEWNWKEALPRLDVAFARRLETECPHVTKTWLECWPEESPPTLRSPALTIDDETKRNRYRIGRASAIPPGMFAFFPHLRLREGDDFTQEEVDGRTPVCLLDEYAASVFFPGGNPLGNTLEINGVAFTVKGIIAQVNRAEREPWGGVWIPFSFHRSVFHSEGAYSLMARTTDPTLAREEIASLYQKAHGVTLKEKYHHFDMVGAQQAQARKEAWLHAVLVMALGLGTLIVGGVGMMNTMLISTTSRISEVGVLRAVGATRGNIVRKFLFESVALSLGGGIVGVFAGLIISQYGLPVLYLVWHQDELWPTALSTHWPIIAVLFGLLVGVVSALGPAVKASLIRPAEALRQE